MKKVFYQATLKLGALAVIALMGTSCNNNGAKIEKEVEGKVEQLADSLKSTVSEGPATTDLDSSRLFVENSKMAVTQVNPNVTRKMVYLNDLMVTIVEFDNGPMAEPDPTHFHKAEQISYIAEGECLVVIGDKQQRLKAGDIFAAPANVPHTVQSLTKKLVLIDSFNPIRLDFIKK